MFLYNGEQDHYFEIKILPDFEKIYSDYYEKFNNPLELTIEAIKKQLLNSNVEYQMNFSVEEYIYKPLKKDYPKVISAVHYLIDQELFKKSAGSIEFTPEGWNWLHGKQKNMQKHSENDSVGRETEDFNVLSIPPGSTEKIKELLGEINKLPNSSTVDKYKNLIAHQLRTILALSLKHYWEKNKKILSRKVKDSLHELIKYTRDKALEENLPSARNISDILRDIRTNLTKELADDVVHCDYKSAKKDEVEKFIKYIEHLLSAIYRNK